MNKNVKFIGTAVGIFTCYFYYGILQETITKGNYNGEKFTYTLSLVFVQCIVNYLYSLIVLKLSPPSGGVNGGQQSQVNRSLYASCSLTYLLAMVTSNMSLQWVPYPTQVVAKSCKPIPVMLLGVLIGGRSYALRKYLFVLTIVVGVALFMYNPKKAGSGPQSGELGIGELLLVMSLAMDGLTGAIQERMRSGPSRPNSGLLMKNMNLYSIFYTLIALILTKEIVSFASFVQRYPEILPNILIFSLASALGQFFIFIMVTEFGPLPCSIVTTTRKFFTVLASVFIFGNLLTQAQWIGAALVFTGLSLDSVYR